jgi:hypothetical protein
MEDSTIMIAIVLILFFVMMNKKSCGCMEKFSYQCEECNDVDLKDQACCELKCDYKGKLDDPLVQKIIQMRGC